MKWKVELMKKEREKEREGKNKWNVRKQLYSHERYLRLEKKELQEKALSQVESEYHFTDDDEWKRWKEWE